MGLSTVIGKTDKDASGSKIEPSMRSTMHRLRTWDEYTFLYFFAYTTTESHEYQHSQQKREFGGRNDSRIPSSRQAILCGYNCL
jgi:hypothetical protein